MRRGGAGGFTLVELLIVVGIIAIIVAITIPNLLASRIGANEAGAVASLRNLVSAQAMLAVSGRIDADRDGKGEYGTFLEMTGRVGTRKGFSPGPPAASDFSLKGETLDPPVLSSAFALVDPAGFSSKSGYVFRIFLPDASSPAGFVHETSVPGIGAGFAGGSGSVGIDSAEASWCAYARPARYGGSGNRRFFVNQGGDLLQASNDRLRSEGATSPLQADGAFLGACITSPLAAGTRGRDGDDWRVAH